MLLDMMGLGFFGWHLYVLTRPRHFLVIIFQDLFFNSLRRNLFSLRNTIIID